MLRERGRDPRRRGAPCRGSQSTLATPIPLPFSLPHRVSGTGGSRGGGTGEGGGGATTSCPRSPGPIKIATLDPPSRFSERALSRSRGARRRRSGAGVPEGSEGTGTEPVSPNPGRGGDTAGTSTGPRPYATHVYSTPSVRRLLLQTRSSIFEGTETTTRVSSCGPSSTRLPLLTWLDPTGYRSHETVPESKSRDPQSSGRDLTWVLGGKVNEE